jgi:hypothetical protein
MSHITRTLNYKMVSSSSMAEETKKVEEIFKRLEDIYPLSYALLRKISINFAKIYGDVNPNSAFEEGQIKNVTIGVGKDSDGTPRLAMGENATIFYTAVVYSILEEITRIMLPDKNFEEIEKEFIINNKACPNPECGEINRITNETCYKCGTKLH